MSIQYYLQKNCLVDTPEAFSAHVLPRKTVSVNEIISYIAKGTTLTELDIRSVIDGLNDGICHHLSLGEKVMLPFAGFSMSVRGTFAGEKDAFDKSRHEMRPSVNPGPIVRAFCKNGIPVEKIRKASLNPAITTFIDGDTGVINTTATPGGIAEIDGYRLKFDLDNPAQGVFFVDASNNETRVSVVIRNKPTNIVFKTPAELEPGTYSIVAKVPGYKTDEILTVKLDHAITVA